MCQELQPELEKAAIQSGSRLDRQEAHNGQNSFLFSYRKFRQTELILFYTSRQAYASMSDSDLNGSVKSCRGGRDRRRFVVQLHLRNN
eukprot:1161600-Pelagomonas_calceolata.AAC.6